VRRVYITFLAFLALPTTAQAACEKSSVLLMGPSWHSESTVKSMAVHDDTVGFGVECDSIYVGAYRNSFHDTSYFVAGIWEPESLQLDRFQAGVGGGVVTGYDKSVTPVRLGQLAAMVYLNLEYQVSRDVSIGSVVMPPTDKEGAWVANFHMKLSGW